MKRSAEQDKLDRDLLMVGVTVRGLKGLWFAAKRGNYSAQRRLLKILSDVPTAYSYVESLAKQYGHTVKAPKIRKSKSKPKKQPTTWQRAAATVGPEGASVFRGGLPTLGKKR